jgi:hypothetical protein
MGKTFIIRLILVSIVLISCSFSKGTDIPEKPPPATKVIPEQPTATAKQVATPEPAPSQTMAKQNTPAPSKTPDLPVYPSPTPYPEEWYALQPGTPLATINIPHEAAGCSWLGVGGQVFGPDTAPVLGLSIVVGGKLEGHQVGSLATTGMETNIGEGGYEVSLADHPVDSTGTVWIQVVDSIGKPMSDKIYFDTYNVCERNFILVNFVRYNPPVSIENGWSAYLPNILKQSIVIPTAAP